MLGVVMTEYEKYLFDLNGYLVIEDLLNKKIVASLNRAIWIPMLP